LGKIRKLIEVDDNLEPKKELSEIFGRFPIDCGKCFKEIDSKYDLVTFCERRDFDNLVWITPIHFECANEISHHNDQILIPVSLMKELDPHAKFHKIFLDNKKDEC